MESLAASRPRSVAVSLGALALAAWSAVAFVGESVRFERARDVARRFTLDRRRPLEIAAVPLQRTADAAAAVVVDAALDDARGSGPPAEIDPDVRALWLQAAGTIGPELEASRELALDAARRRPGRAQHRLLIAAVEEALDKRAGGKGDPGLWIEPFRLAASAAPGLAPIYGALGRAYLQSWPRLNAEQRADASAVWARAFADPDFVAKALMPAGALIGTDAALHLVPEKAPSLRAAYDSLTRSGDLPRAAALQPRLDRALRVEREEELARIAEWLQEGDLESARSACHDWLKRTPMTEFDDPAGRAQTARLLELWPGDKVGPWRSDARAELIRFFLNHREKDVSPDVLLRAADALTGVPDTVRARLRFLAGDPSEADEIRRRSSSPDSFEWVPYLVEVAGARLARGDAGGARVILRGLSPAAAEGCDVMLLRRDVARALDDAEETATANERLRFLLRSSLPPEAWSAAGTLSLCLDPRASAQRELRVGLQADGPAIVAFGWNGGRQGSLLIPAGTTTLRVGVPPLFGRNTFSVASEAGSPIRLGEVAVSEAGDTSGR